jgi:hypothetical protein
MFERSLPQHRRFAVLVRCLLVQCWLVCLLLTASRNASALEEPETPLADPDAALCDPDVVASGGSIECERPREVQLPEVPADSGEAPMCDETGASIGARMQIPELERARFEALPFEALRCEILLALLAGKGLNLPHAAAQLGDRKAPSEPVDLLLSRADAAREVALALPAGADAQLLEEPRSAGLGATPGHGRPVYRPPLQLSSAQLQLPAP